MFFETLDSSAFATTINCRLTKEDLKTILKTLYLEECVYEKCNAEGQSDYKFAQECINYFLRHGTIAAFFMNLARLSNVDEDLRTTLVDKIRTESRKMQDVAAAVRMIAETLDAHRNLEPLQQAMQQYLGRFVAHVAGSLHHPGVLKDLIDLAGDLDRLLKNFDGQEAADPAATDDTATEIAGRLKRIKQKLDTICNGDIDPRHRDGLDRAIQIFNGAVQTGDKAQLQSAANVVNYMLKPLTGLLLLPALQHSQCVSFEHIAVILRYVALQTDPFKRPMLNCRGIVLHKGDIYIRWLDAVKDLDALIDRISLQAGRRNDVWLVAAATDWPVSRTMVRTLCLLAAEDTGTEAAIRDEDERHAAVEGAKLRAEAGLPSALEDLRDRLLDYRDFATKQADLQAVKVAAELAGLAGLNAILENIQQTFH
ncbi:hypothetical protein [Labrenzia sp. OB1]|uniref:hypothetical protein n=1 Tax=Labrenzia sp. OB1 TaxID=1561204 RepID=UPI0007B1B7AD|nr:hypothetical protein [Labrenzia sp. OB1]KZM48975.1 hypothetical protein OA90_17435 [Labrenzia sp. OB1]